MIDPLLETMGSEGGTCFVYFGKAIKFGRDCTGGVKLFILLDAEAS